MAHEAGAAAAFIRATDASPRALAAFIRAKIARTWAMAA
jgi:hypothetical protein